VHAVTHLAVDGAAGLAAGSTSNYFRSRDALLEAVVERFAAREKANWDDIAAPVGPRTPAGLAEALAAFALDATGPHRTLTHRGCGRRATGRPGKSAGASSYSRRHDGGCPRS
jgi:AcrR family transcriptional regulator